MTPFHRVKCRRLLEEAIGVEQRNALRQLGEWLRRARKAALLTQEDLAERAGVSVYTISNLERGVPHAPRPETIRLLAQTLGATPDEMSRLQAATTAPSGSALDTPQRASADSASLRLTALPSPLTALLGREDEVQVVTARLESRQARLLSLVGVGGVGKTRLALECAHRLAQSSGAFPDGIAFVSLGSIPSVGLAPTAIADALGVRESSERPLEDALLSALAHRRVLLVLDNCEHLDGMGSYVARLLMACPNLTALVTSRAALSIAGEHQYQVRPFTLPAEGDVRSLEELAAVPAVALLLERAQAAGAQAQLVPEAAPTLIAICHRLDGLPLAIELAAPQLALLSPDELLARLDHRLSALSAGGSDRPARQQTLRATLDWSYDLLDPAAQAGLRWLAVCAGGSALEAAEAMCAQAVTHSDVAGPFPSPAARAPIEVILHLANQHLLQRQSAVPSATPSAIQIAAERRVTMLATIEEYARERLQERETELFEAHQAHAQVYLRMTETAAAGVQGPEQTRWLERLHAELPNVRAALRWSLEQRNTEVALRFGAALWWYWNTVGMLSEGRDWLEQALALAPPVETLDVAGQQLLAEVYNGAGVLATRQGDFAAAERFHAQALPLRRAMGDPAGLASSLNSLGGLLMQQGRLAEAQAAWEESLTYRRASGQARAIALGLMNLGVLAVNAGEVRQAVSYIEESVPLFRAAGDASMVSNALINLAMASLLAGDLVAAQQNVTEGLEIAHAHELRRVVGLGLIVQSEVAHVHGDLDGAEALAQEGLAVWREVGGQTNVPTMLALQGTLQYERGNLTASAALLGESLALSEQLADAFDLCDVWTRLGHLARLQGRWDEAAAAYQRSLRIHVQMASTAGAPESLEGLAGVWWEQEKTERALDVYALAQALRTRTGAARAPYNDRWVASLVSAIHSLSGAEQWEALANATSELTVADCQARMAEFAQQP
jgi:predicted ATPase/DNA-binding XRE family transcriptional regulator